MQEKMHYNKSNKAAQKEVKKDTQIQIRCLPCQKSRYVKAAQAENTKLSVWILDACEQKINNKLNSTEDKK